MPWNVVAVGSSADPTTPLYPDLTPERELVLDRHDGDVQRAVAKALRVTEVVDGRKRELQRLDGVRIEVLVTQSRLLVLCKKYDKGGGWFGGWLSLFLNLFSKLFAMFRTRGKALVGHVRYPWVAAVGHHPKAGMLSSNELRVTMRTPEGDGTRQVMLDLEFAPSVDTARLAATIAQRAARFRLERTELDEGEREWLEPLADARPLAAAEKGSFALHAFSTSWRVSEKSALTGLAAVES